MADLVIRGMEKPIDCHSCWMRVYCFERGIGVWGCGKGKPCTLIPLPEGHGRLIDAEAYVDYMQNRYDNNEITNGDWIDFRLSLKDQPTIVPAEGGTENGN